MANETPSQEPTRGPVQGADEPIAPTTPSAPAAVVTDKTVAPQPAPAPATPPVVERPAEVRIPSAVNTRSGRGSTVLKPPALPTVKPREQRNVFRAPNPLGTVPIHEEVRLVNDVNLTLLYEKLDRLDRDMGPAVHTTDVQAADQMAALYRIIMNSVEREQGELEFASTWRLIMRMITESPKGGFTANSLWKGKPQWSLGAEKFAHFEALINLIEVSVRHRKDYYRFVHQGKVLQGFQGSAQGRLGLFYRSFGHND